MTIYYIAYTSRSLGCEQGSKANHHSEGSWDSCPEQEEEYSRELMLFELLRLLSWFSALRQWLEVEPSGDQWRPLSSYSVRRRLCPAPPIRTMACSLARSDSRRALLV